MMLKGKTVLITGGSRGIGRAMVEKFVANGANVAFTYLSSAAGAKALVNELSTATNKVKAYQSNAGVFAEAEELVKSVLADFGTVDVLINNAGITRDNLLMRMSEEQWDEVITTNLKSIFNLTKHIVRPMMKNRAGSIINISSVVGVFGNAGQSNYAASKAGIIGFSKSMAKEIGSRGIRCNVLAPGFIATEMTENLDDKTKAQFLANIPLKRLAKSEEVADAALFLASDMSVYITGQVLSICGGLNM